MTNQNKLANVRISKKMSELVKKYQDYSDNIRASPKISKFVKKILIDQKKLKYVT